MKKSLLLLGALAAMMTANAQEAPKPILEDITPRGYDFSQYEAGTVFKVHDGQGGNAEHACWSPMAGIYDPVAAATDGHFTVYCRRGTAAENTPENIEATNAGITIRDFGGYLGKCLVINQPWSPLGSAIGAANDIYGEGNAPWPYMPNGGASSHCITFYCDKDAIQHDWAGKAIRVRLVFDVLHRGCHMNSKNQDNGLIDAYAFSDILAVDNNGEAGGWYTPSVEYVIDPEPTKSALKPQVVVPAHGSEFARWENEGTCLAEMPADPKPLMITGLDPLDNAGHTNAEDTPHYQMQLDRFMVYEWDVYMSGANQNLKVNFDFNFSNVSIVIKEIKFFNITNARDLLVFDENGDDFTYGPNSLLEKRQKSWRYYTEKGVKEFAEGAGEEPGDKLADGEYCFRHADTGYYLAPGLSYGTLAVVKPQARIVNLEANDDDTYNVTTSLGTLKISDDGNEVFMDGNTPLATTITPVDGGYTLSVGGKYLAKNEHFNWMTSDWHKDQAHCDEGEQWSLKLVENADDAAVWEIVSREEMLAAFENATPEKPAEATFLIKAAGIDVNDTDNATAWNYTVGGKDTDIVFPDGGWGSGMTEWHNKATYAWLVNDNPEADSEDVVSQEVEGVPAGYYVATYRVVNQDNTPLTVKFNDVEAEAFPYSNSDLWHNSVCEPLKNGVKTAKFHVGEDGKLSIKMIKQSKAGEQNRFAFKHVYLSYIGEAVAEEDGKTAETAWQISTPEDIEAMKDKVSTAAPTYFKLMNDIDMTGINHLPTVGNQNNDFGKTIHFDGNNHVISNLTSVAEDEEFYYASLFGVFQGSVKNLGLVDVNLKSKLGVGGIGGYVGYGNVDNTTVDNCYVTGTLVNPTAYAGGIMGTNGADATITNSYAQVDVKGGNYAGGLVGRGREDITIENSYVSGTVGSSEGKTATLALVAATDKTAGVTLTVQNVVAVNTGTESTNNYGTMMTGSVSTNIADVATWAAFNEGKLFNELPALNWQDVDASGIDAVVAEENADAPVEYYNLQGIRVENPSNGLYIRKQGSKATKVLVR